MSTIKTAIAAAVTITALGMSACSGESAATVTPEVTSTPTATPTPTPDPEPLPEPEPEPEPEPASLKATCPQVEAATPNDMFAKASKWATALNTLHELNAAGDLETQNALSRLIPAVEDMANDPAPGEDFIDAGTAVIDALDNLADRCAAVGSSALQ